MADQRRRTPMKIGDVMPQVLQQRGLRERVEQAGVVDEWPALVGRQIAAITKPLSVAADGTLFVAVTTSAWMNELSLMEPDLLRALNATEGRAPVKRIRWLLKRD